MRTALVAGTGLIGTSAALALSARGVTVYLRDPHEPSAQHAASMGAGTLAAPKDPVDLAILAAPPEHIGALLAQLQGERVAHAYTDVASVKKLPWQDSARHGCDTTSYVGGHPMAGRERSGPLAARADLFTGHPWVLTPHPTTRSETINAVLEMVSLCGAVPVVSAEDDHDDAVALISHAPHILSAILAGRLNSAPPLALRIAGAGVRDVTRIAAGDPTLWSQILKANAPAVLAVLEDVYKALGTTVQALRDLTVGGDHEQRGAMKELGGVLAHGKAGRAALPPQRGTVAATTSVRVRQTGVGGEIGRLLARAAEVGTAVHDIRTDSEAVTLTIDRDGDLSLRQSLTEAGWRIVPGHDAVTCATA